MWFELFYTFLGGLGIFFFGMKNLSEALQSLSGSLIRKVINTVTANRFMAVGVGMVVTMLVQSSTISTVMFVGLVNAGLMNLFQAIGLIFGANIGTTITGWIISLKVGKYGLLLVGLGVFPMLFSDAPKVKQTGRMLLAFGLIFLGLEWMGGAFRPLRTSEGFISLLQYFSADSIPTLLACIFMGAALTCIVQSSSAMLAVTIALAMTGAITFQTAAALVVGENIGTTITAQLASVTGNTQAKRAARAHAIFNGLGVIWLIPLFWIFLDVVDWVVPGVPDMLAEDGSKPFVAAHIAAAHTLFNVTNTFMFLPFVNHLARLVTWMVPASKKKEIPHLEFLPATTELLAPTIALSAAEKEMLQLARRTDKILKRTKEYLELEAPPVKLRRQIQKDEDITDSIQKEITVFLCRTQEVKLSAEESRFAYALIRAADELESIADYCITLIVHKDRLVEGEENLTEEARNELVQYMDLVIAYFESVYQHLSTGSLDMDVVYQEMEDIKEEEKSIRKRHRDRIIKGVCGAIPGIMFSDMLVAISKMRSHTTNVAEAMDS
jgi:phosphate:Na+ symporter